MQHLVTPYSKAIEPFAWWENAFTEEQLEWLQNKAKEATISATVGGKLQGNLPNPDVRRAELNWMYKDKESKWVFETLSSVVSSLNAEFFGFDLLGFGEAFQLTNYHEDNQGMYRWHQDFGANVSRKLSLVLQLSEPEEYEGGELQILTSVDPISIKKQRGLITVFPSWILHQVTPVVKGNRQTLVTWVAGPAFR